MDVSSIQREGLKWKARSETTCSEDLKCKARPAKLYDDVEILHQKNAI